MVDLSAFWESDHLGKCLSEAALGHRTWQSALDDLCGQAGATGAVFLPFKGTAASLPASSGCQEIAHRYVQQSWHKIDARSPSIPIIQQRGFATDLDIMTPEQIERNPYYQENLRSFGLKWFVALRIEGFAREWTLSLHRSATEGPFQEAEIERLLRLAPDLSSAVALSLDVASCASDAAFEAFSLGGKAVVMLDRFGGVIRVTGAADRLFDDDLRIRSNRIFSTCRQSMARLEQAIHRACTQPEECMNSPVLLRRPNSTPIVAHVSPAHGIAKDVFSSCQTYVILVDPYQRSTPAEGTLQALFGLTRTEEVLATRLSHGQSLRDIATTMAISYETARTHIRRIFSKIGVNDQADLIAFLSHFDI